MSTRCYIGVKRPDHSIEFVYCHHDGYPEGVGWTLQDFYPDGNIDEILKVGAMSSLGDTPELCEFYKDPENHSIKRDCLWAYKKYVKDSDAEYAYIFQDGKWYYSKKYYIGRDRAGWMQFDMGPWTEVD